MENISGVKQLNKQEAIKSVKNTVKTSKKLFSSGTAANKMGSKTNEPKDQK